MYITFAVNASNISISFVGLSAVEFAVEFAVGLIVDNVDVVAVVDNDDGNGIFGKSFNNIGGNCNSTFSSGLLLLMTIRKFVTTNKVEE